MHDKRQRHATLAAQHPLQPTPLPEPQDRSNFEDCFLCLSIASSQGRG
jgi:hypothetical protein